MCVSRDPPSRPRAQIPKTGGTSVQFDLNRGARQFNLSVVQVMPRDWAALANHSASMVFLGHQGFGLAPGFTARRPFVTTVVRDPTDRMLSHWNYVRSNTLFDGFDFASALAVSLAVPPTHLNNQLSILDNALVHWLCPTKGMYYTSNASRALWDAADQNFALEWCPAGMSAALEAALVNLCDIHLVGTLENLGAYWYRLRRLLPWIREGWKMPPHRNPSKPSAWYVHRSDLANETVARIRDHLWADYAIYDIVKRRETVGDDEGDCFVM